MTEQRESLFLAGAGYSARYLAALWTKAGRGPVYGTTRSADKCAALETDGIMPVLLDGGDVPVEVLAGSHWVISTPPGDEGCPSLNLFGGSASKAASITYLSTTGVYGDLNGGWAFEWSSLNPGSPRSERRVEAETAWAAARPDANIARLPGIYGPGRSALDRTRGEDARRIIKPGQVFSRIHVEDIASGLMAIIARSAGAGVFNLCDDEAAPPQDVIAYAAHLQGIEPPPEVAFESADLSAMARSFYSECKRVSNARTKAQLHWRPTYPTYREGLKAIYEGMEGKGED